MAAQGGKLDPGQAALGLPVAPFVETVSADREGWVTAIDPMALGYGVISLGGGRMRQDDVVDPRVGFELEVEVGTRVARGNPIGVVHAASTDGLAAGIRVLRDAVAIGAEDEAAPLPGLLERIRSTD